MGHFPATMASDYDAKKPATFRNMPATFQRLSGIPGKNPGIPGKNGGKSKILAKNGSKIGKMGKFTIFQGKSGRVLLLSLWPVVGLCKGRFPFGV